MQRFRLSCALLLLSAAALAQAPATAKMPEGFGIEAIDKSADPCVDFYQYACGNWLKNTEIPADQTEWVSFSELYERNLVTLRGILEKSSASSTNRSAIDQKIGDYYGACMSPGRGLPPVHDSPTGRPGIGAAGAGTAR